MTGQTSLPSQGSSILFSFAFFSFKKIVNNRSVVLLPSHHTLPWRKTDVALDRITSVKECQISADIDPQRASAFPTFSCHALLGQSGEGMGHCPYIYVLYTSVLVLSVVFCNACSFLVIRFAPLDPFRNVLSLTDVYCLTLSALFCQTDGKLFSNDHAHDLTAS